MSDEKGRNWKTQLKYFSVYLAIFLLSIIALIFGYVVARFEPLLFVLGLFVAQPERFAGVNSLVAHLFNEGGVAGLIACGLAVTIERVSAKELIRLADDQRTAIIEQAQRLAARERDAIKKDVFYYALGHYIPQEIRDEIRAQILTADFIRKDMSMVYTLKPLVDLGSRSTYVLVDFLMKYDIVNLTTEKQPFTLKSSFRKSPTEALADQAKFITIEVVGSENPIKLSEGQIPTKLSENILSLKYEKPFWVKPGIANPATVVIHSQSVKHSAGGFSYFTFDYHTCDLKLSVHVPDNSLQVYSGASPGDWLTQTFNHKPTDGYYSWQLIRPLLAFQGVFVCWDPIKSLTGDHTSTDPIPVQNETPNQVSQMMT